MLFDLSLTHKTQVLLFYFLTFFCMVSNIWIRGLRLRVFLNRIKVDSNKKNHKSMQFISIKKYFNNRPRSFELILFD